MNNNKILACVDQSPYAQAVADGAAWAAKCIEAPLEFLQVIDHHPERGSDKDHSGTIGINAAQNLLNELSNEDELRTKTIREQGRVFLDRLRQQALERGVQTVDVRQRHGNLEDTLSEQESSLQLLVLGQRGASSNGANQKIGRHVEWVVQALHKPILTVTTPFKTPERVLIAFDGSAITRRAVEMVAQSPLFKGLSIFVLMSGKENKEGAKQLEWAKSTLEAADLEVSCSQVSGHETEVVLQTIQAQSIDLLIMGAYSHSSLRRFFFGSKTSSLLRLAQVPILLIR